MRAVDFRFPLIGLAAALLLSGCVAVPPETAQHVPPVSPSANIPLPSFYGLYAMDQGTLVRLVGSSNWEVRTWSAREDLPPDVSFLVYSRDLTMTARPLDQMILLERVASVREQQTAAGTVTPEPVGSTWAAPNLPDYRMMLNFEPVPDHPDMVVAAPEEPLSPGLYSLKLVGGEVQASRFGVAWSSVAVNDYASRYCVDQYPDGYRPCGAAMPTNAAVPNAPTTGTADFVVRNLHSVHTTANDGVPALIIEGQLVNMSPIPAIMPPLAAALLDADNHVLQALPSVTPPTTPLGPHGTYDFRITVTNPAPDAARVRVTPMA